MIRVRSDIFLAELSVLFLRRSALAGPIRYWPPRLWNVPLKVLPCTTPLTLGPSILPRKTSTCRVLVPTTRCCPLIVPSTPPDWLGPLKCPFTLVPSCCSSRYLDDVLPL